MDAFTRVVVRLLPFGLLCLSIVAVPLRILDAQGLPRYQALRAELHHLNRHNTQLRVDVQRLEATVKALRTDLNEIEAIARDELGMIKPGELLIQF